MRRIRKWWIALAGAAVLAIIGGGAVMAQTATPGTGTGTSFLDRVAQKLGIDTPKLQSAIKSAKSDEIDARVASGQLTQAQADALKQKIANAPADAPFFGGGFGGPGGHMGRGGGFSDQTALASFLGITPAQLRTELDASGATLATVAQAHGKSRDDLKTFLTSDAKTHLQQEVSDGRITQAQADARLAQVTANLDARIDATEPAGHGYGPDGMGPGMDDGGFGAPTIPGATSTATANNG